jgi:hypothetical protein
MSPDQSTLAAGEFQSLTSADLTHNARSAAS